MHKIFIPANDLQTLYRVEKNGAIIGDIVAIEVENNGTLKTLNGAEVRAGNYIVITTAVPITSKLLVLYNIRSTTENERVDSDTILKMVSDIEKLKIAIENRISVNELDKYIQKLSMFK